MNSCIDKKFGKLTIISYAPNRNGHSKVNCVCDCGNKCTIFLGNLKKGYTKSCGCLMKGRFSDVYYAKKRLYTIYKSLSARTRDYSFELDFEEFFNHTQQNCYYCGDPPKRLFKFRKTYQNFLYNGIDRVDNTKGYEKNNVVPCCTECNYAKRDSIQEEFFNKIKKCYEHLHNMGQL